VKKLDVVIIGAGAAGLAAGAALARAGLSFAIFEARRRIGGRVLTRRAAGLPLAVELGPEFVHGGAPETYRLLREASLPSYEVSGDQWRAAGGSVQPMNSPWRIDRVLVRIDRTRPDESFAAFLARHPGGRRLAGDRMSAAGFVQGFHAADLDRISAHSIAPVEVESSDSVLRTARIPDGYDRVTGWLARPIRRSIHLGAEVSAISWRRGQARVRLRTGRPRPTPVQARAVVITVPVGVLNAPPGTRGSITFDPDPPRARHAIQHLAMGSVTHLPIWFDRMPWADLGSRRTREKLEGLSFLFTPHGRFNVWWSAHPMKSPFLVGWSGGPPGAELSKQTPDRILEIALNELGAAFGISYRRLKARVRRSWIQNWERDPYARGAYSYALVGGAEAGDALARPIEGTLFFAGEATATVTGTVEGALQSGRRAARQVLRALGSSAVRHRRARGR
jgi:monoamine oxidase